MVSIDFHNSHLVIGFNSKILFINVNESKLEKCLSLPPDLKGVKGSSGQANENDMDVDDKDQQETSKNDKQALEMNEKSSVQHLLVSPNGKYLAVTVAGSKLLLLYRIPSNGNDLELLSIRGIPRVSSAIAFAANSNLVLVCDKTGDCYAYDVGDHEKAGEWILGHLSILLDVVFTPNHRFIITSDRDEKIRVTNYPQTHDIESYCLGHREYVSSIKLLPTNPDKYLISLSGDCTVKFWEYSIGHQVHEIKIPSPGIRFAMNKITNTVSHLVVLLYQPYENVHIYKIEEMNDSIGCDLISCHDFNPKTIVNFCYGRDSHLYLLTRSKEKYLSLEILSYINECNRYERNEPEISTLSNIIMDCFKGEEIPESEDISNWFKKKFDNVTEYLERKKRRIEEKCSR